MNTENMQTNIIQAMIGSKIMYLTIINEQYRRKE